MNIVEPHGLCKRYGKAMRVKHLDLSLIHISAKGDFPKSITLLEALAVFDFLLWYNCGAVLWRRGLRPWLLPLFGVLLVLLAVEWTLSLIHI